MRAFKFSLIAATAFSCIATIGVNPVVNGAPAEALARREDPLYVPY